MTAVLQIFTEALEKATGHSYVSAITYLPLRMPAYKEVTFTLRRLDGDPSECLLYELRYRERITTDEEKEIVINNLTKEFIAYVLRNLLKSK